MKMNRKSRVLLNLAIAASLFAFAACSDYLEDFQDKYDDGKAFAEISSDSDNGDDDGSSDSKLSSSSKGNGDAESSDSSDSSSSAANSEEAHCTGTVIYDYKNPGILGFGLQFFTNATATKLPENKQGIELTSNTVKDFAIFTLIKNDLHDVSSWEGLCIEYSSNEDIPLYLADSLENIEQINLPANDHFKEISWADTTSRKISLNGRVSFNKFDAFSFEISTTQKVVTISRITTIAKVVPGSSSSVAESSSRAFEPCKGSVIYDASMDSLYGVFGYPFMADLASEMQASSKGIKTKLRYHTDFLTLALADLSKDKTRDIETWGGLCIEYSSDGQADFVLLNDSLEKVRRFLSNELPVTNGDKASFKWLWSENEKLQEKQVELGYSNEPLSINKVSRLHFDNYYLSKTTTITIFRITTINEVDLDVGSSSSVAESSSSIAFDNGPCTGDIVFDENNSNNNFSESFIPNNSSVVSSNEFTIPEGEISSYLYTLSSTYTSDSTFDITSWEGLCVEYEASEDIYLSINTASYGNLRNGVASKATLPKTNGETKRKTWMWNDFSPNGPAIASNTAILQVSPSTNSNKSAVHIHLITTAMNTPSNPQKASLTEAQFARVDLLNWQLHDRTWQDPSGSTARDACGITDNDILKAKDPTLYSYVDAKEYCNKLSDANGTWRLPKKTEWESLLSTFDNWGQDATNTYHFLFGDEPINNYGYCVSNKPIERKLGFWTAEGGFAEFSPKQQNSDYSEMTYIEGSNQSGYANVRCVQDAK